MEMPKANDTTIGTKTSNSVSVADNDELSKRLAALRSA